MVLLSEPQVLCKKLCLCRGIVREACEVEVGKRATREKVAGEHLTDGLYVEAEPSETILSTKEEGEDKGETQCKKVSPAWQSRLEAG